ncbi:hypothetical protein ccbrp13_41800 [Ktedonobacteria bacterium brp13]|nr:hypothetical protein ccbrp13_41800 [Ktedonobacteria bacterium brp13]
MNIIDISAATGYLSTQLIKHHHDTQMLTISPENVQKELQGIDQIANHSVMIIIVTMNATLDAYPSKHKNFTRESM